MSNCSETYRVDLVGYKGSTDLISGDSEKFILLWNFNEISL